MTDRIIARVRFVDGERDVYETPDGEQYVIGDDGAKVYGVWVLTEAAEGLTPIIVPKDPGTS